MENKTIYMDYNATTPTDPRVLEVMKDYFFEKFGNPSSIYEIARENKKEIEKARQKVAELIDAEPEEIFFTSGGTESDNWAIKGISFALKNKGNHIITSQIEHHAVLNTCKFLSKIGYEITYAPVDKYGVVDVDFIRKSIKKETILITIMHANNEIGTIQPIEEIAKIAKENGIYFHSDCVQTVGKIPVSVKKLGVDIISLSAHKFYGPKGVGAIYIKKGTKIETFIHGGEQEKGKRGGTYNVPGIIGLGKACEIAKEEMEEEAKKVKYLRDKLEKGIMENIPEIIINGHPENRLYNTLNLCVKYVEGESILLNLDFEKIYASSGSACTSGSLEPSHVLLAIGIPPEIAHGSLRFSLGKYNKEEDVDKVLDVLPKIVEKLRKMSPFWEKK
ncbi:MAG: cysteine desulfurase NifS [Candidatus Omnitrophica bacterium]|nr:cysteine desulfurase NifS [Candidatus Omnitrophota bacterium]MCM8807681.1 cysteine desulfurase NifS [Candidatus Omnitrophota bacterium]